MSAANDITVMIDRLRRAGIPMDNLCYELDEPEWRRFLEYLQGFARYQGKDLSYVEDCHYMGLHIQKRRSDLNSGSHQ